MFALMILVAVPAPELVIVPVLLMGAPAIEIALAPVASSVRLPPVPELLMALVRASVAVEVDNFRS